MSVYISGLKIPQDGRVTLQIDSNGGVYVVNKFSIVSEKYEKSMTATEIQPHGRLGDLDKLYEYMENYEDNGGATVIVNHDLIHRDSILYAIEDAPTVIEAEGEKEATE